MKPDNFVHLHRHSEFSRLDGLGTAQQYAKEAAKLGQSALALTDHGTLSGALHHIKACRDASIVPVMGVEAYYRPDRRSKETRSASHLCLFAKDLQGWHNLLEIVSVSYGNIEDGGGFYQYPCVDFELLKKYREGLACSSACISSWLSKLIGQGDSASVTRYITQMLNIFRDDFWIEIMPHDFDEQRVLNLELVRIAQERSIPIIATNDAHFPYKDWAETHKIAKMCGASTSFGKVEKDRASGKQLDYLSELNPTLYLAHGLQMEVWFQHNHPDISERVVEEALANTREFCQRIAPLYLPSRPKLPKVAESIGDPEAVLRQWIQEGLQRLRENYPPEHWEKWPFEDYEARVASEWEILKSKGVIDYFVMVGAIVRWAKRQGIRVGLGRGSAAGCLISYLVGIVAIDPIPWGLLFERFLNPERKGLPDIDIDFQSDKRALVKQHIADTYGQDHVADIITHSRFQPRSVIQTLCRVYDVPYTEAHAVTDTIEIRQDSEQTTLEEIVPLNPALQHFRETYPHIWEHALRLEGTVANAGKHAAGIIITPLPVQHYMALERGKQGDLVTSWSDAADFPAVSDAGFVKLDALGITGLQKHADALEAIRRSHGDVVELNDLPPLRDPDDVDPEVMDGFIKGWTTGVFQFGGRGITDLIGQIKPTSALDLAAANALYRPGPMKGGVTWDYAKRKHDGDWELWHESLEPVLGKTYGLIAYQEQVMEIAKQLGGFSGAEADDLRKAMGKLYRIKGGSAAKDFMGRFQEKWDRNAPPRVGQQTADLIWAKILEFGHYGFNLTLRSDTVVERFTTNQYDPDPNITLQEIWNRFYGSKKNTPVGEKYRNRGLWIRGYDKDTGRITKKKVVDIHDHGVQSLYRVTLENGLSISASARHRHLTPDGWRTVDELRIGDQLIFDTKAQDATAASSGVIEKGAGKDWIARSAIRQKARDGRMRPALHGHSAGLALVTEELPEACEFCGAVEVPLERAHLDHNRRNNSRENVKHLCNPCHKLHDGSRRGGPWSRGSISGFSRIVSIEYDGEHQTYDLEVEGATEMDHNYVANGIVTHNSHSASYALQAYQDMWLKVRYPVEFYAALLTHEDDDDKVKAAVREARARGIRVLAPDVNRSQLGWSADEGALRMGLLAIKGVGDRGAQVILIERRNGDFKDAQDLRERVASRAVNSRAIDALTKAGAFDFAGARDEYTAKEYVKYERELLNISITVPSVLEEYKEFLQENVYKEHEIREYGPGYEVIVGGEIIKVDKRKTKKGQPFANITLVFEENEWRVKFWKEALENFDDLLEEGSCVMIKGVTNEYNGSVTIIAREVSTIEDAAPAPELPPLPFLVR